MSDKHKAAQTIPLIVADIYELAGRFRENGEQIAARVGQTQARWQILSAASADLMTVPQIARRLGVTRQNVQRIADRLVDEQCARYQHNPDHRGSPHLVLTDNGRAALAKLSRAADAYHERVAGYLDQKEFIAIHQLLRRLLAVLTAAKPVHSKSTHKRRNESGQTRN